MKSKLKSYTIKNRIIKVEAKNKREAKVLLLQELAKINKKCFEPTLLENGGSHVSR